MDDVYNSGQSRALVVDDDPTILRIMTRLLRPWGYEVITAEDGSDAIAKLGAQPDVQLVVSDVDMPRTDGFSVSHWVQQHRPDVPVILVTGRCATEDMLDGYATGARYYITKPFDDFRLTDVMLHLTGRRSEAPRHELEARML